MGQVVGYVWEEVLFVYAWREYRGMGVAFFAQVNNLTLIDDEVRINLINL